MCGAVAFAAEPAGFQSRVVPFFEAHCIGCHGPEKSKGKVTLHTLGGDLAEGKDLEQWETILEVLESGEMPPEDEPQPDKADREAMVRWIEAGLRERVSSEAREERIPTTRRLTNFEYQNTMRDLFGIDIDLIKNLPQDPLKPYHFNNTAEFMLMGPEQMEGYHQSSRRMLASAIVDPGKPEIHRTAQSFKPDGVPEAGMELDEVGVYGNRRHSAAWGMGLKSWPATGEYRIRVKAAAILPPGHQDLPLRLVMGYPLQENSSTLQVEPVGTVTLANDADHPQTYEFRGRIENHPVRPAQGKERPVLHITPQNLFDNGQLNDNLAGFDGSWALTVPRAVVQSIEFEAPVADVWPPEHHTRILFDSPLRESDPDGYVRAVLGRFLPRAFRRPASEEEIDHFAELHAMIRPEFDTLEAALRETLSMVLISPAFLYHTTGEGEDAPRQYELASRLSYFLWGSMPDGMLMELASLGMLDDPVVIEAQVTRMLEDRRSAAFVANFARQWLSVDKAKEVNVNRDVFPRFLYLVHIGERAGEEVPYRPTIRDYMSAETVAFIGELVRRNASVLNIVDSDFACLNEPLAAHYGVEGVKGHEIRPVPVQPGHRLGGLLTQGSVLVGNSTGSAPHPIYRAVWLREAILGDEVHPPPAEVPALSDTAGAEAENATTIAEMLRRHRQVESCNDCHARLDPWGIPFEEYNASGLYQPMVPANGVKIRKFNPAVDKDLAGYQAYLKSVNTVAAAAVSRLPNGPEINGVAELKAYLLRDRKKDIAANVIRRLLAYGIGRGLDYRDRFAVDELLKQAEAKDFKMRDMIISVCQSRTFRTLQTNPVTQ